MLVLASVQCGRGSREVFPPGFAFCSLPIAREPLSTKTIHSRWLNHPFQKNMISPIFMGKKQQLSPYKFQLFLDVCYFALLATILQRCFRVNKHSGDARGYCLLELRCFKQWEIPESAKCNASFHLAATYPLGGKLSITLTNLNTKKKTTEIWSEIHLINHERVLSLMFSLIYVTLSTSPPPTAFV